MKKYPRHKITTIQDLIDQINDGNVRLLADGLRDYVYAINDLKKKPGITPNPYFEWVQDGSSDVKIHIERNK